MTHWQCQSEKVWKRVKVKKYENVKKAFYSSILAFKSSSVKVWNCDIHQRHHTYQSCFWARIVQHLAGDKCYQVKVNQNCAETFVISSPTSANCNNWPESILLDIHTDDDSGYFCSFSGTYQLKNPLRDKEFPWKLWNSKEWLMFFFSKFSP